MTIAQRRLTVHLAANLVSSRQVQKLATANTLSDASPPSRKEFPLALTLNVFFLAALWFGLCRELSGEWSVNEQYNFGWFVPFFALYLFWLRWQDRPEPTANFHSQISNLSALVIAIVALLLLLPIRLFEIANPEWRLLAWIHAGVVVTLTLLMIWCTGGKAWLRHFAFPVAFIFVAVPWPTTLETPVIQGLMRAVARVAAETAMLLGTPAQVEGNLIRVSTGLVGVNEACSGIRSLQTSLMVGLLFGELKRLSMLRRVVLVACAVAIALLANFVRAVFLVRIAATENLSAVGRWHDIAGYSIILLVFVATLALAHSLGKTKVSPQESEVATPRSAIGSPYLATAICWLLLVEIGTASWYRLHERNLVSGPQWSVQWPEQAANFRKLKVEEEIRACTPVRRSAGSQLDNRFADSQLRYDFLSFLRFSMEPGEKQRASGELTPARCLFACKRLDPGGGSWRAQLSGKRFVRIAVSPFRISAHSRGFSAADSTCILLFVGGSRFGVQMAS